ncbi:Methylase involved in ubiquinone/menaquinone biosynthesis [Leptospira biflexa serovar Patoc strain 'Patoc 1 (Ames)']|uniref:Putative SAM-dependent methyltransferase n=1 Tax=Leptospira biflexa serovar Patoc (strain Patoc 1 / ATCC 23582 / Paris) TaxID=456481 RepID=B0ST44_LEPBP|nr:class I SAM-dependent methyltransferase [Leptospira biflexa]ABZ94621.1 Methylase involved in ubiquinone/menaquinone biosynthesis [Leptospira biflexa serovar Patoc strain 'Patoc 1 (Ames)']ABZ98284.1 Putative SAM-dependent methyltransferase [Leptospira biflexa serovar Patoc strain 'Patoc 1 (Paris)']
METYDKIGFNYNKTRNADPRIASIIEKSLHLNENNLKLLDVGAGTGNYSKFFYSKGYDVTALEPSEVMIAQALENNNIKWIKGTAEHIDIQNNSFDGVFSVLASHHFNNLQLAISEINRTLKSKHFAVIFTADPSVVSKKSWLYDYFKIVFEKAISNYINIENFRSLIESTANTHVEIIDYPLPDNLVDNFFASGWKNPSLYLDQNFISGISPLVSLETNTLNQIQKKLENDLKNGTWNSKFGRILEENYFDGGYRFLVWQKP